ncbi:MAG TPA: WYL domain-containing protein, partial [Candidatus Competibacteraceae bacterium]|nr:WYL domain-containing protein [Candidatus Competibacteraceae bacterium]
PSMAFHLSETPLSDDQAIEMLDAQTYRLRATVTNTLQLRWWLLGFGAQVEVREPASLRADMAGRARALAALYQGD